MIGAPTITASNENLKSFNPFARAARRPRSYKSRSVSKWRLSAPGAWQKSSDARCRSLASRRRAANVPESSRFSPAYLCGNQISGATPSTRHCPCDCICSMVWRFYAIDATLSP